MCSALSVCISVPISFYMSVYVSRSDTEHSPGWSSGNEVLSERNARV